MPGFDGTGPRGMGPMTGRGMGYCVLPAGKVPPRPMMPFYFVPPYPCGRGRGLPPCGPYGRGFGRRRYGW